jgi:hypothetical protein
MTQVMETDAGQASPIKAGPAGGRLRRPSSRRQRHDGDPGPGLTQHVGLCRYDQTKLCRCLRDDAMVLILQGAGLMGRFTPRHYS